MSSTPFVKFKQDLGNDKVALNTAGYGMTESGIWVPIKVTDEGVQEVQLSGTINEIIAQGETTVAAGAVVMVASNVSVDNYREVYAYAGQTIVGRSWKMELRFRTPWSTSGGWDASVTFEEYTKEGNTKNMSIDAVKCRSEIASLIIRNNHTEDVTFRWRIGGLR